MSAGAVKPAAGGMTMLEMLDLLKDEHGEQRRRVCLFGPSGASKTESAIALVKMVCLPQGLKARVYCGDGSAANYVNSGLVKRGIVELCDFSIYDWPLSTITQICQGYWPEDGKPGAPLVPTPKEKLAEYGMFIFETLSVMGEYMMGGKKGGLAEQASRGIKIGENSPIQVQDAEVASWSTDRNGNKVPIYKPGTGTGMMHGGNPMSHFNVGQGKMMMGIDHTHSLPGWVLCLTHEKMSQDKLGSTGKGDSLETTLGDKLICPDLGVGQAKLGNVSKKFAETLHIDIAHQIVSGQQDKATGKGIREDQYEYRLYTRDHFDPDGVVPVKYRSVVRCERPEMIQPYYVAKTPGAHIRQLYLDIARANKATLADLDAELAQYAPNQQVA